MKKNFIIAIAAVSIVSLFAIAYINRGEITLRIAENKVPEYINAFCECDELISELKEFSPIIVEYWSVMEKEDKIYIAKSVQAIKSARQKAILNGEADLTYEELEIMIKKSKEIALKYKNF